MKRLACICLMLMTSTGCQGLLHELQPHRLWRMNYQEPAGRTDEVYFSVPDPLDVPIQLGEDLSVEGEPSHITTELTGQQ